MTDDNASRKNFIPNWFFPVFTAITILVVAWMIYDLVAGNGPDGSGLLWVLVWALLAIDRWRMRKKN